MIHCFNINEIKLDYIVIYSIKLLLNNYKLKLLNNKRIVSSVCH